MNFCDGVGQERFTLTLFGGPTLKLNERVVPLTGFQGALISLIASHDNGVSRERASLMMWGTDNEVSLRHRLSQILYSLRQRIPEASPIDITNNRLTISADSIRSDLDDFREQMREGLLVQAWSLCEPGFLTGVRPPTKDFEDWLEGKRLKLRADLRQCATEEWRKNSAEGRWKKAHEAATVLLNLDPDSEDTLRKLLQSRAMSGSPQEAEAAYYSFSERMNSKTKATWKPAAETRQLRERITAMASESSLDSLMPTTSRNDPALIGRDEELGRIDRLLRTVPTERIRTILITGEEGVGKTRLVRQSLLAAPLAGVRILNGQGAELERSISLNVLLEALSHPIAEEALRRLGEPWRSVLLTLMPEFRKALGPLLELPYIRPEESPRRLFEAIRQLFEEMVIDGPIVIFLDDFEWADETSVAVLEYLRRRWDSGMITLIIVLSAERQALDGLVARFLRDIRPTEGDEHIELLELDSNAAEELAQEVSGSTLSAIERKHLASLAGHMPFFIIELVLEYRAGRFSAGPHTHDSISIPLSIRQVLEKRLINLAATPKLILDTLSAYGHPTTLADLCAMTELSQEACVRALEVLQSFRLVYWILGRVAPRHELIRQTVYSGLSESRRPWIHGRIARHLMQLSPPPFGQLALHFDRAQVPAEALGFSLKAAAGAEAVGGHREALKYLMIAQRNTDDPIETSEILGRIGHLHYLHRDFGEAMPLLAMAAERFRGLGRTHESLFAATERIDASSRIERTRSQECVDQLSAVKIEARKNGFWDVVAKALDIEAQMFNHAGDVTGVRRVLGEAEDCLRQDNHLAECSALCTMAVHIFYGSPVRAIESARRAVTIAETHGIREHLLRAQNRLLLVMSQQGLLHSEEAKRLLSRARTIAKDSGDVFQRFNLEANLGVWLLDSGNPDAASIAFAQAGAIIKNTAASDAQIYLLCNLGELELLRGEVSQAEQLFAQAQSMTASRTPTYMLSSLVANLGQCALHRGDLRQARRLEESLPADPSFWYFEPATIAHFRAKVLERRGLAREAVAYLDAVAENIEGRLITQWIKLKSEQVRLLAKVDKQQARNLARLVYPIPFQLGLEERSTQLALMSNC